MQITELQKLILKQAAEKGFGTKPSEISVGDKIALIHTEVSEAYEAYRHQNMKGKDGFAEELADVIIRTIHLASVFDVNLEKEISAKMKINDDRVWDWNRLNEK